MMTFFESPADSDPNVFLYSFNTVVLLITVLLIRTILGLIIERNERLTVEVRRRWLVSLRNTLLFITIVGLLFIWAPQLRTFTVSLVAIAVALVLATKELILCLSGAVLRMTTNAFDVGDQIEVGGTRGFVLDVNWFTITLVETGPGRSSNQYTGRTVVVPNAMLFTAPVINETPTKKYILHVITVPLPSADDWQVAERVLLDAAQTECQPFLEEAKRYMRKLEGRKWLDPPIIEPRVTIQLQETGCINLLVRITCPADDRWSVEQAILRRFLSSLAVNGFRWTYGDNKTTKTPRFSRDS